MRCGVNIATKTINPVASQFVNHGLYDLNALNKSTGIWIPATRTRRTPNISHVNASDHALGQATSVRDVVGDYS